jgi:hypothetical protein
MRRHLNYANVVATLALVFAMSGGALAAKHYLINSTKQINPKVLKKLKGNTGKAGKTGATGPAGAAGPAGANGTNGANGIGPAFSAFHDASVEITSNDSTNPTQVATLSGLPAGKYVVNAKLYTYDTNATSEDIVICRLSAGGDSDEIVTHTSSSSKAGYGESIATFPLQLVHQFNSTGSVSVACYFSTGADKDVFANHTKITAIQVSALTNTGV